jgi:DNA-binding CsgD family transcriptional regulator
MDGLSAGMFLVDDGGEIVHANAAGHDLLADGDVLRANGHRLAAADGRIDNVFRGVFRSSGEGDESVGTKGTAIALAGKRGDDHVAHVLPLTGGERRRAGKAHSAAAAVFVRKAEAHLRAPPEAVARHYQLTPTELRVLLAIVDVGGVPEVAEALGVADTTVKTHLGRLYQKTGTSRQADLVKLVARFASPLVA